MKTIVTFGLALLVHGQLLVAHGASLGQLPLPSQHSFQRRSQSPWYFSNSNLSESEPSLLSDSSGISDGTESLASVMSTDSSRGSVASMDPIDVNPLEFTSPLFIAAVQSQFANYHNLQVAIGYLWQAYRTPEVQTELHAYDEHGPLQLQQQALGIATLNYVGSNFARLWNAYPMADMDDYNNRLSADDNANTLRAYIQLMQDTVAEEYQDQATVTFLDRAMDVMDAVTEVHRARRTMGLVAELARATDYPQTLRDFIADADLGPNGDDEVLIQAFTDGPEGESNHLLSLDEVIEFMDGLFFNRALVLYRRFNSGP